MADALAKAPPEMIVEVEDDSEDEEGEKDDGGIKCVDKCICLCLVWPVKLIH